MLAILLWNLKKKLITALKTLLALAIMVILAMQLLGVIEDATNYYHRWINRSNPHGNPLKVFHETGCPVAGAEKPASRQFFQ